MQQSKLIQLLRRLDKEELNNFDKFLQSPYHNSSRKLIIFFYLIKKHQRNNYTHSRLNKEKVFQKIYPNAPVYQDSNLRNLMALLKNQLEAFLVNEAFKKEKSFYDKLLTKVYRKWA